MGVHEGKATAQQSIVQSSHITEDWFRKFSHFEQRELQGLLDYSKEAWLNGKKAMYVMPDGSVEQIDIEPLTHMESEYGIFVSDAGKDIEKKQKIEGLAQAMVQNGAKMSSIVDVFASDSFSQIKDKIIQAEKAAEELQKAQEEAERQMEEQKLAVQQQAIQQAALDKEKDRQLEIEKALIAAEASDKSTSVSLEKMMKDFELKQKELEIKQRELDIKSSQNQQ
jgi:hypothetical protein